MARRAGGGATADGANGTSQYAVPQPSDRPGASKRGVEPGLHLVATPIGNLGDITLRALEILRAADVIACEDTRVSAKLLGRYGITNRRIAYHDHNAERVRPGLLARLAEGQVVALISDAGTPLVSDPGHKLVRAALDRSLPVHVAPGASAPLAALLLSGLPSDRFMFAGFLDSRQTARRRDLASLAAVPATLVFFEAPQRLAASLADMAQVLGDRQAAVARELTKLHEEVARGRLGELAARYTAAGPPKGEIVVVVGPPEAAAADAADLDAALRRALRTESVRDAAATVAAASGLPRRKVYARALEIAAETP
ncbi:MAG TPA: 16S rRNA (cytidine(1402)-2'-O)-methyltransferase [Stellaceae bacterium]|nr:16S rRNA (cytidine(1402)-2'-O)-methyltransferase [Stellaceae bacterium]